MSKKLLSVVLALALALSCFAVSAFALGDYGYEDEADAASYTQTWALSEPQDIGGGEYAVDVILTTNYLVGPIQFKVLKTVSAGSLALVDAYEGEDIPENWNADVSFLDTTGEVTVIPYPTEDGVNALDCAGGKVVATLVFAASADVAATAAIDVADAKSASNPGGTLIAARMSDGNVVTGAAITGQTVTNTSNPSATFGSAAVAPTLAVKAGKAGVIDTSRTALAHDDSYTEIAGGCTGYIYGVELSAGDTVNSVFEVSGDGTMEIVNGAAGKEGTGSIVKVKDTSGNVVETYCLVIFGDVDGDGEAGATDMGAIDLHNSGMYGFDQETFDDILGYYGSLLPYQIFAADVDANGEAGAIDMGNIDLHNSGMFGYDQETFDDILGLEGSITQAYVIGLLNA